MFENKTAETIHEDMLQQVNKDFDKSLGSFIYDATKPTAIELEKAYEAIDNIIDKFSIDTLIGQDLEQRVYEQTGLKRKQATYARGLLKVIGSGTIKEGDLFQTESGIQFKSLETKAINSQDTITIQCVKAGSAGNMPANTVSIMSSTIQGITSIINEDSIEGGYDAELDQELLERYYEKKQSPATSGNVAQYRMWAKQVPGVGDAKVEPLWNGDNTLKVIIIDADKQPANQALIDEVQAYIDPDISGLGKGVAPIGARCTVVSAQGVSIDISFSMVQDSAYTVETIKENIKRALTDYFKDIAFNKSALSYAKIGSIILSTEGVLDYTNLKVNLGTSNIGIGFDQVPVLGVMSIE